MIGLGSDDVLLFARRRTAYERATGGKIIALWHSDFGSDVVAGALDKWRSKPGALEPVAPTAPARPSWGADGAHFAGKSVMGSVAASNKRLLLPAAANKIPSGSRMHSFAVARLSAISGTNRWLWSMTDDPITTAISRLRVTSSATLTGESSGQLVAGGGFVDTTLPHIFEVYLDSAGTLCIAVDGILLGTTGSGIVTTVNMGYVALGGRSIGGSAQDAFASAFGFCRDTLSAAERANLLALLRSDFALARPPLDVLGSILRLEYDPARGISTSAGRVTGLTDTVQSHALTPVAAGNQPLHTPNDTDFKYWPSFTSEVTGNDGLRSTASAPGDLIPAGKPYLAWLGNIAAPTGSPTEFFCGGGANSATQTFCLYRDVATNRIKAVVNTVAQAMEYACPTGVHLIELIYNGTTLELWQDNVLQASQPGAPDTNLGLRNICFGERMDGLRWLNAENAYFLMCDSPPSAAQRTALLPFWRSRGAPV